MTERCCLSDSRLWRHCPGNLNPADIPSRGINSEKLLASKLWWNGPEFLCLPEDQWPNMNNIPASEITNAELVKKPIVTTRILLNTNCNKNPPLLDEIIDCTRYSKLDKLLYVTAYVLRFVNALKHCNKKGNPGTDSNVQLTVEEIDKAEQLWIHSLQVRSFLIEITFLQSCNQAPPIRVHQFGLFLDDTGLL